MLFLYYIYIVIKRGALIDIHLNCLYLEYTFNIIKS